MDSEEEQFTLSKWIDDIAETRKELDAHPRYFDLTVPKYRLTGKRDHQSVVLQGDDRNHEWMIDEQQRKLRWHYQLQCPVPLHRLYGRRVTFGNLVTTGESLTKKR